MNWVTVHCFASGRLPLPLYEYLAVVEEAGFRVDRYRGMVLVSDDWMPPHHSAMHRTTA